MQNESSLQSLLRNHQVSADDFFQAKGIAAQIRTNNSWSRFTKYCKTHRNFTTRMLYLAFNVSCAQLEDGCIKRAAYAITQLLGNEEAQLFALFFEAGEKAEDLGAEILYEMQSGIKSEAQRLFRFDSDEQQTSVDEQPRPVEITGKELVDLALEILKNPQKNESCLGYLQKIFLFFIRHSPNPVLAYFQSCPEKVKLLINSLSYSSIGSILAQLLTCQDQKKEYKYQTLKKNILVQTIEAIFSKIEDINYFDGALIFLEEILNTSKQSYYEYFEDFKRIANYLVSGPVLTRLYDQLFKLNHLSFSNASKFLESVFTRMNNEVQDSNQQEKEEQGPSMNFQIQIFVTNVADLIMLVAKFHSFSSLTKISYLIFLQALLNCSALKSASFDLNDPSFEGLFQSYNSEKGGGIVKNKIYTLIHKLLSKSSLEQIKAYLEQHPNLYESYFGVIQAANYSNTKIYNKNQRSAFDVGLINQLTRKEQAALSAASKALGKDFKRICKKYDSKIASFTSSPVQEELNFHYFDRQSKGNPQNGQTGFTLNFVGKNNISIPLLHLPQKFNHAGEENMEGRSHQHNETNQNDKQKQAQEVLQSEQVNSPKQAELNCQLQTPLQINDKKNQSESRTMTFDLTQSFEINEKSVSKEPETGSHKKQNSFLLSIPNLKLIMDAQKKAQLMSDSFGQEKYDNAKRATDSSSFDQERARFFARHLKIYA